MNNVSDPFLSMALFPELPPQTTSSAKRLQNKFMWLALRLPKYICPKLFHDSTGLPYVKDRILSCATKCQDKNCTKPSSRGVNIFQQAQSRLGPFPNAIQRELTILRRERQPRLHKTKTAITEIKAVQLHRKHNLKDLLFE